MIWSIPFWLKSTPACNTYFLKYLHITCYVNIAHQPPQQLSRRNSFLPQRTRPFASLPQPQRKIRYIYYIIFPRKVFLPFCFFSFLVPQYDRQFAATRIVPPTNFCLYVGVARPGQWNQSPHAHAFSQGLNLEPKKLPGYSEPFFCKCWVPLCICVQ